MTWDLDCLTEQILLLQQELCLNKKYPTDINCGVVTEFV